MKTIPSPKKQPEKADKKGNSRRESKLSEIRTRVHSGSYKVDSVAIAKALFFWR